MNARSLKIAALAAWITILVVQPAWAQPVAPLVVYGTVKVDGASVAVDTQITAWCTELQAGITLTKMDQGQSVYAMDVLADNPDTPAKDGCVPNDIVSFKIGDRAADQTTPWTMDSYELPLTAGAGVRIFLPLVLR